MTHIDLFSGIGGFALAARWAGIKTIQFVERDPFCQKVLAKNFKEVPIHDNITTYHFYTAGTRPFLITGGFPCQPFSVAGKRRGKEDDRYLWPEMLRIIKEARPDWVIGENVAGFINMGLDDCISDLESEGYEVQAFVIPACAVQAPHRRDRVWIVANASSNKLGTRAGQNSKTNSLQEINREKYVLPGRAFGTNCNASDSQRIGSRSGLCRNRSEQNGNQFTNGNRDASNTQRTRLEGRNPARLGSSERWDTEYAFDDFRQDKRKPWSEPWIEAATRLCFVDDGLPGGLVRPNKGWRVNALKAAGNVIVPQVAYEIMKAIVATA